MEKRCSSIFSHILWGAIRCELPKGHTGSHEISKHALLDDISKMLKAGEPDHIVAEWSESAGMDLVRKQNADNA